MKLQSAANDSFTKKFLMNISSNFCKRCCRCKWQHFQLFANLSFYYIFISGWGGGGAGGGAPIGGVAVTCARSRVNRNPYLEMS